MEVSLVKIIKVTWNARKEKSIKICAKLCVAVGSKCSRVEFKLKEYDAKIANKLCPNAKFKLKEVYSS